MVGDYVSPGFEIFFWVYWALVLFLMGLLTASYFIKSHVLLNVSVAMLLVVTLMLFIFAACETAFVV